MRPVEYCLKELLFDYDCVTIPGLGGFIMQSQPARLNKGKTRLSPPARFPAFNSLLSHDDGLLASYIAKARHISYREAANIVSGFADDCKIKLASGESISLEGIGELSPGPGGEIRFNQLNQSNFLAGVYGMDPINLYPLVTPQKPARLEQKPADRRSRPAEYRKTGSVAWTLAVSLPIILFLLYGIIFPSSIQNIYTNYSGIIYDFAHPIQTEKPLANQSHVAIPLPEIISLPVINSKSEENIAPETKEIPEVKKDQAVVTVHAGSPKYYIIGGCFESESNAGKFLAELIGRGFEAEQAGTNKSGHIRISYKSFGDRSSAIPYLNMIRNEENASAWLLKY